MTTDTLEKNETLFQNKGQIFGRFACAAYNNTKNKKTKDAKHL